MSRARHTTGCWAILRLAPGADPAGAVDERLLRRHGGRLMAASAAPEVIEGGAMEGAVVVLRFPTRADIARWRADPDWRPPAGLQRLVVVEGAEPWR